jgi:hypothetical protein
MTTQPAHLVPTTPLSPEGYESPARAQECSKPPDPRPHAANRLRMPRVARRFLCSALLVACMMAAVAGCGFANSVRGTGKSPSLSLGSAPRAGIPGSGGRGHRSPRLPRIRA